MEYNYSNCVCVRRKISKLIREKNNDQRIMRTVLEVMETLLDSEQVLCTDNFYTSVKLAHELTHSIGTLQETEKLNLIRTFS